MDFMRAHVIGFVMGVGATLGAGWAMGSAGASFARTLDRGSFDSTVDTVFANYVDPVDQERVLSAGLRAMLAELDPHSHFITAQERKNLGRGRKQGTTGLSVALQIDRHADHGTRTLKVLAVAPSSPAERVGLRPGDELLRIRDKDVAVLDSQIEVELLLTGAVGDQVAIAAQSPREPGPRELSLVLDRAHHHDVEYGDIVLPDGRKLFHLVIRRFGAGSGDAVKQGLSARRRLLGDTLAGIVLDVRGNPGGEVDQALIVADLFISSGVITRTRGRGGRVRRSESAHAPYTDSTTPLVVLQDRHSASASELLAVALQEHHRAQVVGERSYGKGTVQEVLGLPDGSVATFTTARYFSPEDHVIDGVGVTPDVQVIFDPATPDPGQVDEGVMAAARCLGVELDVAISG